MARTLEGNFELPAQVRFARSALGESFEGKVSSGAFTLTLPRLSDDPDESRFSVCSPFPDNHRISPGPPFDSWGRGGTFPSGDGNYENPISSYVQRVAFTLVEATETDDEIWNFAVRFGHEIDIWFSVIAEWLDLWTGQRLHPDDNRPPTTSGHISEVSEEVKGGSGWSPGGEAFIGGEAVTKSIMAAACSRANENDFPPDEWRLFLKAVRWRSMRLGVIDAATAAEIAIEKRLFAELSSRFKSGDREPEKRIADCKGISDKLTMLECISPPERSRVRRVNDRIARPRNNAVHAGKVPDQSTTVRLLKTARELLDVYSPLFRPESP